MPLTHPSMSSLRSGQIWHIVGIVDGPLVGVDTSRRLGDPRRGVHDVGRGLGRWSEGRFLPIELTPEVELNHVEDSEIDEELDEFHNGHEGHAEV